MRTFLPLYCWERNGETMTSKVVVLLSGGMDSCVTAAIAAEQHGAEGLALLHASYGQRTEQRERRAFDDIAGFYGVRERLVVRLDHFTRIGGSALTDARIAVPEHARVTPVSGSSIPVTYVPFRNAHFLSVAVGGAGALGAERGYIGAAAGDRFRYPHLPPRHSP